MLDQVSQLQGGAGRLAAVPGEAGRERGVWLPAPGPPPPSITRLQLANIGCDVVTNTNARTPGPPRQTFLQSVSMQEFLWSRVWVQFRWLMFLLASLTYKT